MQTVVRNLYQLSTRTCARGLLRNPPRIFNKFIQVNHSMKYNFCVAQEETYQKENIEKRTFKAETKKLLDIVAKSLYTDKEIFIRELLSNASDALEKQRFNILSGKDTAGQENELEINITLDQDKNTIIVQDSGSGMSRQQLIEDLGTIARSGSAEFAKNESTSSEARDNIIGQFGVGFYSSFIVADMVEVISKTQDCKNAHMWTSDGSGEFEISELENVDFERGTKIVMHLKTENDEFTKKDTVQRIVQKYSNFLNFPVNINGETFNIVQAIWSRSKQDISEDEYKSFYEFISNSKLDYQYKLHYNTDSPLEIHSLIYVPSMHMENYGMQTQEELDVHLYCRKVLIKSKCKELIPNYLRFLKGIVDCSDLPMNISRESYQNSALMARLKGVITRRILKMFEEEARKNPVGYQKWYKDFQFFLKEGLATDHDNQDQLLKLQRFEANWTDEPISLDDYVAKIPETQKKIYFLFGANKEAVLSSPYYEPFQGSDIPVLFSYIHLDEIIFEQVGKYKDLEFVNAEKDSNNIPDLKAHTDKVKKEREENDVPFFGIPEEEQIPFCLWAKNELQPLVNEVVISNRLKNSPAIVTSQMSSGQRAMMQIMQSQQQGGQMPQQENIKMEINPEHHMIVKLNLTRKIDSRTSTLVMQQILDNCLGTSGIQIDTAAFKERINLLMLQVLDNTLGDTASHGTVEASRPETVQEDNLDAEVVLDNDGNPQVLKK